MAKPTYQQLIERAALTALDHYRATVAYKALKAELRSMYDTYFEAHGRPEGRFDPFNEDFLPVINFTNPQYVRVCLAKKAEYNAKRRHETAIRALASASKEAQ